MSFCLLTIPSFYVNFEKILRTDPEIYDIWCFGTILVIFWPFWCQNRNKFKIFKKQKNPSRGPHFTYSYQKSWYLDVSFGRNDWWQTDGRKEGQKEGRKDKEAHRGGCPNYKRSSMFKNHILEQKRKKKNIKTTISQNRGLIGSILICPYSQLKNMRRKNVKNTCVYQKVLIYLFSA